MKQLATTMEKNGKNVWLSKANIFILADLLRSYISPKDTCSNYRLLDAAEKMTVCLYYLKDTRLIWMTSNTIGIHQSTVPLVIPEVCQSITN